MTADRIVRATLRILWVPLCLLVIFWAFRGIAHVVGVPLAKNLFGIFVGTGFLFGCFRFREDATSLERRWQRIGCGGAAFLAYATSFVGILDGTSHWAR